MTNMRNMGIIGKPAPARGQNKKGVFNQGDLNVNKYDSSFGVGLLYAQSYVASTGGTLTIYDGGADLTSTIVAFDQSTSGDALFLPPGNYTIDTSSDSALVHTYSTSMFASGYYGVFGGDPDTTQILADQPGSPRADNCLASWDDAGTISLTLGYLTLRLDHLANAADYRAPLFHGTGTTDLNYIMIKNCAINLENTNLTMLYDNNSDTGDIKFENCSIGNVATFANNYSGSLTNKSADNCLFEPNITTTQWGTLTDCTVNGSYFTVTNNYLIYDTATYSTVGHRYNLTDTTWSAP
ncbi:hypothetical protein OAA34_00330 [bacterium]|nr:hypothetical protein [bacterium]